MKDSWIKTMSVIGHTRPTEGSGNASPTYAVTFEATTNE